MMINRKLYRIIIRILKNCIFIIEHTKTVIAEKVAIFRKRKLWKSVIWTEEEKRKFNEYWILNIGQKISNKWTKLYQLQSGKYQPDYIPEAMYSCRLESSLNDYWYSDVLADKALLEMLCSNAGVTFPKTICGCSGGYFYDSNRNIISKDESFELICKYLKENEKGVIIKPTRDSSSGKGIYFINESKIPELCKIIDKVIHDTRGNYILQALIEPHNILKSLNSTSINTLRVITYIADDKIFHAPISLRIGKNGSLVDNIHAGGLVVGVNDSGKLNEVAYELGYGDLAKKYTKHPNNGILFSEIIIPNISQVVKSAKMLHGRFLHTGFISWDFTIGSKGEIILIEVNLKGQSVWFPQVVNQTSLFGDKIKAVISQAKRVSKDK